ncbi:MAG: metal-dependent hydrolase [Candidatus Woesearchaeota archaeon]
MPDWISHILLALIIGEVLNVRKKSLIVIGAVIPDILKIATFMSFFNVDYTLAYKILFPFHTPFGSLIVACIIALFFEYKYTTTVRLLSIGWGSHFLLDMLQTHPAFGETLIFFPFSWTNIELSILRVDQFYIALAVLAIVYIAVRIVKSMYGSKAGA